MVDLRPSWEDNGRLFPRWWKWSAFQQGGVRVPGALLSLQPLVTPDILSVLILINHSFNLRSLSIDEIEHLFLCLVNIAYSLWSSECWSICPFWGWSYLYYFYWFINIFSMISEYKIFGSYIYCKNRFSSLLHTFILLIKSSDN